MPIIISDALVLSAADDEIPLTHPRILYDDVFGRGGGTLTASSAAAGFEKENAVDYLTYDFWKATSLPARLEVLLPEAQLIDCFLLVAHTLGTEGASVKPQYYNGGWVDLAAEVAPGTDDVLAFLFEGVSTNRISILISGPGDPPAIGVVMAGQALAMQRGVPLDHAPLTMQGKTTFTNNDSESGQWLGRSIRRLAREGVIKFQHLTDEWLRDNFEPFIVAARSYPFGWLWAPVDWPDEAVYCRADEDIKPKEDGLPNTLSVEFKVTGFVGS